MCLENQFGDFRDLADLAPEDDGLWRCKDNGGQPCCQHHQPGGGGDLG